MSETNKVRILVFTEGPLAETHRKSFGTEEYSVGQFKFVVDDVTGTRLGAYRVEAISEGIGRTKWFDEAAFLAEYRRIVESGR